MSRRQMDEGHDHVDGEHAFEPRAILSGDGMLDHQRGGSLMMPTLVESV